MSTPTHYVVTAESLNTMLAATAGEHLYHGRALEVEFRKAAIPVEAVDVWATLGSTVWGDRAELEVYPTTQPSDYFRRVTD